MIVLKSGVTKKPEDISKECIQMIRNKIGPVAAFKNIVVVKRLPKTRSGKIMRRILRKIAEGDFSNFGDTSTLLNPEIVDQIKDGKI